MNQPSGVVSAEPQQQAALRLTIQSDGSDPRRAAEAFAAESRLPLQPEGGFYVNGLAAYRASGRPQAGTWAELTWIAHQGRIFRFEALRSENATGLATPLRRAVETFRPLRRAERRGIREKRLFVVSARPNETLPALAQRTGNAWSVDETAVANGVRIDVRLPRGRLVKIARERDYRGR